MKIGAIEIHWHRGTTTLRDTVLQHMKDDPEVRMIAAKMARSEVKNYLAALAEQAEYPFDSPAGFLRAIRVNLTHLGSTNLNLAEDEPYDQDADSPFNVFEKVTIHDSVYSFKCAMYGDQLHEPCSGTVDDGTGRDCLCPCHTAAALTTLLP